jgi:diguanylate cyclase (GGDEF)-like protein
MRTTWMSVVAIVASIAVLVLTDPGAGVARDVVLVWWVIALLAFVSPWLEFEVEVRRETCTFTFSEVVLVLGLFFASPLGLVAGRLVGEAAHLVARGQRTPGKVLVNLGVALTETVTLLVVYNGLGGAGDILRPTEWLLALTAVAVADLVGYSMVIAALRWHGEPVALGPILTIGALSIPVNTSFALLVGILAVLSPWAILLLAGVGAILVVSYRSRADLEQRFESLSMLYDFTRLVSGAQRPDAVLEAMLTEAKDLLRAERAEIWLEQDDRADLLHLRVDDDGHTVLDVSATMAGRIAGWFAVHPGATIVDRAGAATDGGALLDLIGGEDCILAPITESGVVVGLVAVVNRLGDQNAFRDSDRTMFATLANHASVALENGRLIDRLQREASERRHEALHDMLTGLPNRVLLSERLHDELHRSAEAGTSVAVGLMDLDGFKEVNDTLGHQAGDMVLVEVARRLSLAADSATIVARLGGDEFAVLCSGWAGRDELQELAERIRGELGRPMTIDGIRMNVAVSIGFALAPSDAADAPTLLQRADVAMYSAKAGSGSGIAFYDALRDENSPRRLALATDLRGAIADRQLTLVYQPKTRLGGGDIVGHEALVRWRHPEFGQVFPDEFIPLAERTGAISELTVFVLEAAMSQAEAWSRSGRRWTVAVNVAMRNLVDADFVENVERLLTSTGCDPSLLVLEITETGVMSDPSRTIESLHRLSTLGVSLSVDDFGTGYSSLSYLQQLPIEEIKIDKCFVGQMRTSASADVIVRSVIDLARNLEMRVVAEGVEDEATWHVLEVLGCDIAQGYFIARPMPADEIEVWSESWSAPMATAERQPVRAAGGPPRSAPTIMTGMRGGALVSRAASIVPWDSRGRGRHDRSVV